MKLFAHEPSGFEGDLVTVEVDVRRGIPAVDLVGLADGAVREARERVRAAVRNSGFEFPLDRVLVSLAPSALRKEGAAYDVPIALGILAASGAMPDPGEPVLALGELRLDGQVSAVRAVLPAIAAGLREGLRNFIVPQGNAREARALGEGRIFPIERLSAATDAFIAIRTGQAPPETVDPIHVDLPSSLGDTEGDFADIRGLPRLRRAMEIAAAGGHNLLLFGPPGTGKTLAARRFISLFPDLDRSASIEVTALHSLAAALPPSSGLVVRPPFRSPHHGASFEGILGGGRSLRPGEAALAHHGVLFLDEAPEFHRNVLQALREPLEDRSISIARAGRSVRFPSRFQLLLATNPCPCGNLGREGRPCLCSVIELASYWKRLGAPLLDRVDLRVPVRPLARRDLLGPPGESSAAIRSRVEGAREMQRRRHSPGSLVLNASLDPAMVSRFCGLSGIAQEALVAAVARLDLSSRACHSILKVSRTIADLRGTASIEEEDLLEAIQHRRFGDGDFYWKDA
jgi:magnesium chelatase family protein